MKNRPFKYIIYSFAMLTAVYLILLVPSAKPPSPPAGGQTPFAWNQDQYWKTLEKEFLAAKASGCEQIRLGIDSSFEGINRLVDSLAFKQYEPDDAVFSALESAFFEITPKVGVCHDRLPGYLAAFIKIRTLIKIQSQSWDMNSQVTRDRLYRTIYGGRLATEEVMLQMPPDSLPALVKCGDIPSTTPATEILGAVIHSGDILVSRGGAATSALIARGNDYPGNFSHIALVYVDDKTGQASVIESHIEKGVAIANLDQYLKDTKLRVMILRLRPDLPVLIADSQLPHKAAKWMLEKAKAGHIPYDFQMDYNDTTRFFCSEVASTPYQKFGLSLWTGLSHISSKGVKTWLAAFGVKYFETQEPSDLEYDPQLTVVAEWRDPETLYKDHIDNAVIDVMLESAERGELLDYDWYLLPVARVMKGYSYLLNLIGVIGPVPEGMSASAALRNKWFTARHGKIKERLFKLADQFKNDNGYRPPYWELVALARKTKAD